MFRMPNQWKMIEWFLTYPFTAVGVRELAKNTGASPATVSREARQLLSEGIIKLESERYIAETDSSLYLSLKKSYNLFMINTSGIIPKLVKQYRPGAVVLFGSYARGEDHDRSDIDIALIDPSMKSDIPLRSFETKLKRKISLHFIDFRKISGELRANIINGITLSGFVEKC